MFKLTGIIKKLGPGLLFASSSIGTSHLVLSTRAGAQHGMVYFWIIALCLLLKYPFYEYGARFPAATGKDLLFAYKRQGKWALGLFSLIILVNMFTVTAAVAAVTAGILGIILGTSASQILMLVFVSIFASTGILLLGGYRLLNNLVKLISLVMLLSVGICFFALVLNGPMHTSPEWDPVKLIEGGALVLLVSLIGWIPSGMEASVLYSLWVVKSNENNRALPNEKDVLFDFNIGYLFTALMAFVFLVIGAFAVYGSGEVLEGNSIQFSAALIDIFVSSLGSWSKWIFSIAAFGAIYGTLIVVMDAFSRAFVGCCYLIFNPENKNKKRDYGLSLVLISIGAFIIFSLLAQSMIHMLELATIIGFLFAPIIAYLNFKAILEVEKAGKTRLPKWLKWLSYPGLLFLSSFALYYLYQLI